MSSRWANWLALGFVVATGCAGPTSQVGGSEEGQNAPSAPKGTVSLAVSKPSVSEGGVLTAKILLPAAASEALTYTWTAVDATSGKASDRFESTAGSVIISAGAREASFELKAVQNDLDQDDSSVVIKAVEAKSQESASVQVSVLDDDAPPILSVADVVAFRGTNMQFSAVLSAPSAKPVNFTWATRDISAVGGIDYKGGSGSLTIQPGQTRVQIQIAVNSAPGKTSELQFALQISGIQSATAGDTVATGTISAGTSLQSMVSFETDAFSAPETGGVVSAPLVLSAPVDRDVYVDFEVSGTAGATDHRLRAGRFSIPKGTIKASLPIEIVPDKLHEANETVIVKLVGSTNAAIGVASVFTLTIVDDDPEPQLTLQDASATEGGDLRFSISLDAVSGRDTTVTWQTRSSSADLTDYVEGVGTLTIPAGETIATVTVPTLQDAIYENIETFELQIVNASHATINRGVAVGTILDNDTAPVASFAVGTSSVSEAAGQASVTVRLSEASGATVVVPYFVSGTATPGIDHGLGDGELIIPAGATEATIVVNIFDDALVEGAEQVVIDMGTPRGATAGATLRHSLTITDND